MTDFLETRIVTALAVKLRDAISHPFAIQAQTVNVSASIGIAIYPSDGNTPETLLANADKAMYEAKNDGGNNYRFFRPALSKAH